MTYDSLLLLLTQQGLRLRDFATDAAELVGLRELAGSALHAQVELLLAELEQVIVEILARLGLEIFQFHHSTVRLTKAVWTESFAAARRKASRAVASGTPSISYNMRPGCTT